MPAHIVPSDVEIVYAIGDVHGRADLLAPLLRFIQTASTGRRASVVFLGDLVDRGPASRAVLDLTIETMEQIPDSILCLGNHDEWFLRFLVDDPSMNHELNLWLEQGGAETLRSYDIKRGSALEWRAAILDRYPGHLRLLQEAVLLATWEDFAFVHAGIDPSLRLDEQTRHACLWIRAPFLRHVGALERFVVHGHSPQRPPQAHVTENRISLDTGAVFADVLTAAEFDVTRGTLRFLASGRAGSVREAKPIRVDRGLGTLLVGDQPDGPKNAAANEDRITFAFPKQKGAARRPPSLAGVSGHEKPDTV